MLGSEEKRLDRQGVALPIKSQQQNSLFAELLSSGHEITNNQRQSQAHEGGTVRTSRQAFGWSLWMVFLTQFSTGFPRWSANKAPSKLTPLR
jgi:hypothetical protein